MGSLQVSTNVPIGTPTSVPNNIVPTLPRSAMVQARGNNGEAMTISTTSRSAAAIVGPMAVLASGMKIRAAPNPEKPRASPAMIADVATNARVAAE